MILKDYILVKNGVVVQLMLADDSFADSIKSSWDSVIEQTPDKKAVGPGYLYDIATQTFSPPLAPPPPPAPAAPPPQRKFSKLQFRSLMTFDELVALDNFASSGILPEQKAIITTIMKNFEVAEYIDIGHPLTIQGINYFASIGLITPARVAVLLQTP